jgi:hypothetical protein
VGQVTLSKATPEHVAAVYADAWGAKSKGLEPGAAFKLFLDELDAAERAFKLAYIEKRGKNMKLSDLPILSYVPAPAGMQVAPFHVVKEELCKQGKSLDKYVELVSGHFMKVVALQILTNVLRNEDGEPADREGKLDDWMDRLTVDVRPVFASGFDANAGDLFLLLHSDGSVEENNELRFPNLKDYIRFVMSDQGRPFIDDERPH